MVRRVQTILNPRQLRHVSVVLGRLALGLPATLRFGGLFVSRGYGSVQRAILAALDELEDDSSALLIGAGWPSGRRAAHRLAEQGIVRLLTVSAYGRKMLAVQALAPCSPCA